jgi:hypothetical protein
MLKKMNKKIPRPIADLLTKAGKILRPYGEKLVRFLKPYFAKAVKLLSTFARTRTFKIACGLVVIAIIITGAVMWKKGIGIFDKKARQKKTYEIAVQVRSQENSDPKEDARTSMKAGDVIVVQNEGHSWSNTEKVSYLILKISLTDDQKQKLTSPETRKLSSKELKAKRPKDFDKMPKDEKKRFEDQEKGRPQTETVRVRKYRVNLEDLNFTDPNTLLSAQPYPDKVFDWGIVEEK